MSKRKTERLLGLVVCLLSTRRYLSADQIRAAVPGYPEQDDLFKRMFERDKEDLRELGVPLETGLNHPFDDDPGYRIRQQAYELPELRLEADEAAVLGLAARVWRRAELIKKKKIKIKIKRSHKNLYNIKYNKKKKKK
jgi:proteasome accessory factor B